MEPGRVLARLRFPDAGVVVVVGDVRAPMTDVFNAPVAADGVGELFHVRAEMVLVGELSEVGRYFPTRLDGQALESSRPARLDR